jgi:hypothetical protein
MHDITVAHEPKNSGISLEPRQSPTLPLDDDPQQWLAQLFALDRPPHGPDPRCGCPDCRGLRELAPGRHEVPDDDQDWIEEIEAMWPGEAPPWGAWEPPSGARAARPSRMGGGRGTGLQEIEVAPHGVT